jgi:hypothetical protein
VGLQLKAFLKKINRSLGSQESLVNIEKGYRLNNRGSDSW